jgi:hypothetical protein
MRVTLFHKGFAMTIRRFRSPMKMCAAILAIACFLTFGQGTVSTVLAADPPAPPPTGSNEWETWPKKPEGVTAAGESGGAKASSGISAGTWGWIAGAAALVVLIGVAASGGSGGNGGSPPACNQ